MDASQIGTDFWELSYVWYILGFFLAPRITMIFVFSNYVTDGFRWHHIFNGITIWWMYPALGLGWFSKLLYTLGQGFYPRLLLGVVGYMYLPPENHTAMIIFCVLGFGIDTAVKFRKQIGQKCLTKKTPSFVEGKTFIQKLSFLYLAFANLADGKLSDEETVVMQKKVVNWMELAKQMIDVKSMVENLTSVKIWFYNPEIDRVQETKAVIDDLGANPKFTDLMKQKVLHDLVEIGKADGDFGENEKKLVNFIAKSWGMALPA